MKHGKRPTRRQKQLLEKRKLAPTDWLVTKNLPDRLHVEHRVTGVERVVMKGGGQCAG